MLLNPVRCLVYLLHLDLSSQSVVQREQWLCNLCQRQRSFITQSGLWQQGSLLAIRRSPRKRRNSLDDAAFVINVVSPVALKFEKSPSSSLALRSMYQCGWLLNFFSSLKFVFLFASFSWMVRLVFSGLISKHFR